MDKRTIACILENLLLAIFASSPSHTDTPWCVCQKVDHRTTGQRQIILRAVMSDEWTRGPLDIFGKFVQNNVCKQPFVYILGPLSHRHPMGYLLKSGPQDHNSEFFFRDAMSEKWTRGPLHNFGKFILNKLFKKPFVYILGHLSHRHLMGCVSKTGPEDQKSENKFLRTLGSEILDQRTREIRKTIYRLV